MDTISADRTGWIKYDELAGPVLDSSLWEAMSIGSGPLLEPEAHTTVEHGVVTVDASNQALDNSKRVIFSTQGSRIPADGSLSGSPAPNRSPPRPRPPRTSSRRDKPKAAFDHGGRRGCL